MRHLPLILELFGCLHRDPADFLRYVPRFSHCFCKQWTSPGITLFTCLWDFKWCLQSCDWFNCFWCWVCLCGSFGCRYEVGVMASTVFMCWSRNRRSILTSLQNTRKVRLTVSTRMARAFQLLSKPAVFPFITPLPGPTSTTHKMSPGNCSPNQHGRVAGCGEPGHMSMCIAFKKTIRPNALMEKVY